MRPEDVYDLVNASDPRISPDGSSVAYVVTSIDREASEYRSAVWVARADGSEPPVQFTAGEKRDTMPRCSPDGRRLAFASNRGEDQKAPAQLYAMPARGGEPRKLTDLKESVESIAWSPDSSRIAFTSRVRDEAYEEEDDRKRKPRRFTRVFHKLDAVGSGDSKQLTEGDFEHGAPAWTADGKQLVFNGLRDENWDTTLINRIYVLDAGGGEPRSITGDEGSYEQPAPSPDGARLAYRYEVEDGTHPHHSQIGVMNVDGTGARL